MKLLFLLMGGVDINSEISSDNLSTSGDWSTFENVFSSLISRYIIQSMLLIISVYLLGRLLRYLMGSLIGSTIPPTEPLQTNKIEPLASRNSPFQTQIKQVDLKKQEINNLLFFKNIFQEYEIIRNRNSSIYLKLKDIDNLFLKLSNKILESDSPVKLEEFKIFTNRTTDVITGLSKILNNKNEYNNSDERIRQAHKSLDKIKEILLNNIKNINEEDLKDFEISLTLLEKENRIF